MATVTDGAARSPPPASRRRAGCCRRAWGRLSHDAARALSHPLLPPPTPGGPCREPGWAPLTGRRGSALSSSRDRAEGQAVRARVWARAVLAGCQGGGVSPWSPSADTPLPRQGPQSRAAVPLGARAFRGVGRRAGRAAVQSGPPSRAGGMRRPLPRVSHSVLAAASGRGARRAAPAADADAASWGARVRAQRGRGCPLPQGGSEPARRLRSGPRQGLDPARGSAAV